MENQTVADVAKWAQILAIIFFVQAAFQLLNSSWTASVVNVGLGVLFITGSKSFQMVVDSAGNDMVHMMSALDRVSAVFLIRFILVMIVFVIMGIAMMAMIAALL